MFVAASVWFCCLAPFDKAAVIATAASFTTTLFQPIPSDTFDTAWGLTDLYQFAGRGAVMFLYGLEDTFIVIPDEPPVPAVGITNVLLWLDIDGFILTGGAACGDGCDIPSFLK